MCWHVISQIYSYMVFFCFHSLDETAGHSTDYAASEQVLLLDILIHNRPLFHPLTEELWVCHPIRLTDKQVTVEMQTTHYLKILVWPFGSNPSYWHVCNESVILLCTLVIEAYGKFSNNVLNTLYLNCLPCRVNNALQFFTESASVSFWFHPKSVHDSIVWLIDGTLLGVHKLVKTFICADYCAETMYWAIGNKQETIREQEYITSLEENDL